MGQNITFQENINVFKEENLVWETFKTVLVSILFGIMITVVYSLLVGFRYDLVVTGSMTPVLPIHTLVVIEPTNFEELKIGDITNSDFAGSTLTHRIVRFSEDGNPIVRGDVPGFETKVTKDIYNGRVVYNNYPIGELIFLLKDNLIIVVVGLMILLMWYAFS